jgi:hypothetical protein
MLTSAEVGCVMEKVKYQISILLLGFEDITIQDTIAMLCG